MGSVGSAGSVLSIGSAGSASSLLSAGSQLSIMSAGQRGALLGDRSRIVERVLLATSLGALVAGAVALAAARLRAG